MRKLLLLAACAAACSACSGNVKKSSADLLRRDPYEFLAERLSAPRAGAAASKVAVLPFSYTDRRASDDGVIVAERLLTRLIQEGRLQVVERNLLEKVMGELKLQNSGTVDEASIKSLGRILGVDAVITGTLTRHTDGGLEINARMIGAESAVVMSAAAATVLTDWDSRSYKTEPKPAAAPLPQPQQAVAVSAAEGTFPAAWRYRENFRVLERSGAPLSSYQLLVTFDSASPIRLGRMKADCSDVRFANSDGSSPLPYWIEGGCNTAVTKAWVRLPYLAARAVKNIYLYYGNPAAGPGASGEKTFLFFDDFDDGAIDPAKWSSPAPGCPVAETGGRMVFTGCSSGSSTRRGVLLAVPVLKPPYAVEFSGVTDDAGTNGMRRDLALRWDGGTNGAYNSLTNSIEIAFYDGYRIVPGCTSIGCSESGLTAITPTLGGTPGRSIFSSEKLLQPGVWRNYRVTDAGGLITAYWGDRRLLSAPAADTGGEHMGLTAREYPDGAKVYFDDVRVRRLASPEPDVYLYKAADLDGGSKYRNMR